MNKSEILSAFNKHIVEFFSDVSTIFPDNHDISVSHTSIVGLKKTNPKLIINMWKEYIADKYKVQISEGNIDFIINKNYATDLSSIAESNKILEKIEQLRDPIRQMGKENLQKSIKYIQNLTKLCETYHSL